MEKRTNFRSKLGAILAASGSAVGLGNVWRFSTEVGANGGAAFILIYVLCVLLLGLPVMVGEFIIGRHSHANTVDAYRKLAPRTGWIVQGFLGVFTGWFILSYYSVVAGWTLGYLGSSVAGRVTHIEDSAAFFSTFTSSPWWAIGCMVTVLLITHLIIVRGVQNGIERFSKLMMPMLLIIIIGLGIASLTMPGAKTGLQFLFKPDFSKITSSTVLSAMGQAFFSLSLGMGALCTYASYFSDDTRLTRAAGSVVTIDTLVAILSGFIIFPAVFSISTVAPDAGPGLVFITLPEVFKAAFADVPWLGYLFAVLFYLLLLLAALTSTISLHETATAFLHEQGIPRHRAAWIVTGVSILFGTLCALSFGLLKDLKPFFGMTFFDFFDYFSAKVLLPLGGLLISLFVGWKLDRQLVKDEITNHGRYKTPLCGLLLFLLKWFAPIAISLIFLNELGIFK